MGKRAGVATTFDFEGLEGRMTELRSAYETRVGLSLQTVEDEDQQKWLHGEHARVAVAIAEELAELTAVREDAASRKVLYRSRARREALAELSKNALKGECSVALIRQRIAVAEAFGRADEDGIHKPFADRSWTWFRAVLNASKRESRDPMDLAEEAYRRDWSVQGLNALGKSADDPVAALSWGCAECGAEGTITTTPERAGLAMRCPVCLAMAERELQGRANLHEIGYVGSLQ